MAKVGLENDTLKQPKCPSNWEYSTGQRQMLDIQSGEQIDRLSFSSQRVQNKKDKVMQDLSETLFQRGFLVLGPQTQSPENTYFRCT